MGEQGLNMRQTKVSCDGQLYQIVEQFLLWGRHMNNNTLNSLQSATPGRSMKTHSKKNSVFWRHWGHNIHVLFSGSFLTRAQNSLHVTLFLSYVPTLTVLFLGVWKRVVFFFQWLLYVYRCFAYMCVWAASACLMPSGQKRTQDPLELGLSTAVSSQVGAEHRTLLLWKSANKHRAPSLQSHCHAFKNNFKGSEASPHMPGWVVVEKS